MLCTMSRRSASNLSKSLFCGGHWFKSKMIFVSCVVVALFMAVEEKYFPSHAFDDTFYIRDQAFQITVSWRYGYVHIGLDPSLRAAVRLQCSTKCFRSVMYIWRYGLPWKKVLNAVVAELSIHKLKNQRRRIDIKRHTKNHKAYQKGNMPHI